MIGGGANAERLAALTIGVDATLTDAMVTLGKGAVDIALVVDDDGVLLATVSDGDIRRALLGGATLDAPALPAANRDFTAVTKSMAPRAVLELMSARWLSEIPVIDDDGKLVGLRLLRELITAVDRDELVVIMAGGRGRRLRPLTDQMPKPMLSVGGRPILERIVTHLTRSGLRRLRIAVNYEADQIRAHFGDGQAFHCAIEYLEEQADAPLGTAGALSLLAPDDVEDGSTILVMNGDLVGGFDVVSVLDAHRDMGNDVTVATTRYTHQVPFGVLDVERSGVVTGIAEKPQVNWQVSAGIYVIASSLLRVVPAGRHFDMTELIAAALDEGCRVGTHELEGTWLDVGRPADFEHAQNLGLQ